MLFVRPCVDSPRSPHNVIKVVSLPLRKRLSACCVLWTYSIFFFAMVLAVADKSISEALAQAETNSTAVEQLVNEALMSERSHYDALRSCPNKKVLLLEGDSWFDLPAWDTDVVDALRNHKDADNRRSYVVVSVADAGDTLENMAFNGQLIEIATELRRLEQWECKPRAILLSVGGNDVIGPDIMILLNHSKSSLYREQNGDILNNDVLSVVLKRFRSYVVDYIQAITLLCNEFYARLDNDSQVCKKIPIIIHGYDYPEATGISYRMIFGLFDIKGPWLRPAFDAKQQDANKMIKVREWEKDSVHRGREKVSVLRYLVNTFNDQLSSAVNEVGYNGKVFNPVCYLDLRDVVEKTKGGGWADEAHPNGKAMNAIAAKFSASIEECSM